MGYCERCGIELEPGMDVCPLCGGSSVSGEIPVRGEYEVHPDDSVREGISVRAIYVRTVLLVLLVPVLVTALVDLIVEPGLTWAPVVWISLGVVGFALLNPLVLRSELLIFFLDLLAVVLLLFGIDWLFNGVNWFFQIGLPLVTAIGVIGAALVLLVPNVRPLVAIAAIILGGAAVCVAVEISLSIFLRGGIGLSWSPVVVISTLPLGAALILFEYTVGRYLDFRRRFHL